MGNSMNLVDLQLMQLRNEFRNRYGNIVDKVFNPERLHELDNSKYNLFEVFELLFQVYEDLERRYNLEFSIHINNNSISLGLDWLMTCILVEEDVERSGTYIRLPDFILPKDKIRKINSVEKNNSYSHNGYRIIKTLEIICKSWGFNGVKVTHITNGELIQTLIADGYKNIYKLKGEKEVYEEDYIKFILTNEEIKSKYNIQNKLISNKLEPKNFLEIIKEKVAYFKCR